MMNIVWFRNDLRLKHNRIIEYLSCKNEKFVAIFILDPNILSSTPDVRKYFLFQSLINLNNNLKELGSSLVLFYGEPSLVFKEIIKTFKNVKLHFSKDVTSFSIKRDQEIKNLFLSHNLTFNTYKNINLIDENDRILNKNQEPFKVFTPFRNSLFEKLKNSPNLYKFTNYYSNPMKDDDIVVFQKIPFFYKIEDLYYALDKNLLIKGGESEAEFLWQDFKNNKIKNYNIHRNFLDIEGTSKLSPHLKFGTISVYQIIDEIINSDLINSEGGIAFLDEIIWREFYKYINIHFPFVEKSNFNKLFDTYEWEEDEENFIKWSNGKTGFPIIDACMRCLNTTGWLHNRGRMIVASFLCKNLQIHWKKGEDYFKSKLIDWDKTSNNGGWQWVAGTGTDAAPYFRIFNTILQSQKFDPEGNFIKTYVEELKHVPKEYIHEPYKMPLSLQHKTNCIIGVDYPKPIINLEKTRQIALNKYKKLKT